MSTLMLIMMKLMRNNDDEDAHCDYEDENSQFFLISLIQQIFLVPIVMGGTL